MGGSAVAGLALLALPVDFFDHGRSLCLSQVLLARECPGCGMTRACHHALHLDFAGAWQYNPRWVVVLPLLAFLWSRELWTQARRAGWINRKRA